MAERKIRIRNFRNIGVEDGQELLLNTSLAKGEMGSLVIVVGPNNCGKSNCLDALTTLGYKDRLTSKDIPDFINGNPQPELSLVIADGDVTLGLNKTLVDNRKELVQFFYKDTLKRITAEPKLVAMPSKKALDFAIAIIQFNVANGQHGRLPSPIRQLAVDVNNTKQLVDNYPIVAAVHSVNTSVWGQTYYRNNLGMPYGETDVQAILGEFEPNIPLIPAEIAEWQDKNRIDVIPSILRFTETVTSHSQLLVTPDQVGTSPFFKALFASIDYNIDELVNCYKKAREQNLYGLLKKTAKEINTRLAEVSSQFNKMFFLTDKKYNFELTLEKDAVYLSIFIDDIVLHLDKQSAGFRWFFNFYFTVIMQTSLKRGDIIIMDEPATNLHMQGIQELRAFIKDYAYKTELTFVVSTHLPFFVDVNHLEEVRIVNRVGSGAVIESKFHAIGGGQETDALKPIKDALTVGRFVLYDQGNMHTVFVEGITDYCYLSAFKNLFKIDNIVLLPIQGISKPGIIDTLIKVERMPTILVDGDAAGKIFKEKNLGRKNVEIISLADIDSSWKNIEDLFSAEDKPKTKYFNDCVAFKNRLTSSRVTKITKENFKKLLDNIAI